MTYASGLEAKLLRTHAIFGLKKARQHLTVLTIGFDAN